MARLRSGVKQITIYVPEIVYEDLRTKAFLERTSNPRYGGSFLYGRPMVGHGLYGYRPWPDAMLRTMAKHIRAHAPPDADPSSWDYE